MSKYELIGDYIHFIKDNTYINTNQFVLYKIAHNRSFKFFPNQKLAQNFIDEYRKAHPDCICEITTTGQVSFEKTSYHIECYSDISKPYNYTIYDDSWVNLSDVENAIKQIIQKKDVVNIE